MTATASFLLSSTISTSWIGILRFWPEHSHGTSPISWLTTLSDVNLMAHFHELIIVTDSELKMLGLDGLLVVFFTVITC